MTEITFWEMMQLVGIFFIVLLCVCAAATAIYIFREMFAEQNEKIRRLKKGD